MHCVEVLSERRVRLGWGQDELAERATVSSRAVTDLESGRARLLADALRLADDDREEFLTVGGEPRGPRFSEAVEFRLLGPFEIDAMRPVSIRRDRGLLAVLLLEHELWPGPVLTDVATGVLRDRFTAHVMLALYSPPKPPRCSAPLYFWAPTCRGAELSRRRG